MPECYIHQGEHFPPEALETHHIRPQAYGGGDEPNNLCHLCDTCHGITHDAALKLYSGKTGEAKDIVERYLLEQPARQERMWRLVVAVAEARQDHTRSQDIPEAGLEADRPTVKMMLEVPDWLHHRLKSLSAGRGLYRYVMELLEQHCLVATQKSGAPAEELYGVKRESSGPAISNLPLMNIK